MWLGRSVGRSVCQGCLRSLCGFLGRPVIRSVEWGSAPLRGWSGAAPHSWGVPHERGRLRAGNPKPHKPSPQSLARIRPRSWGGARWGATSAWCALGNLRDFGGGLAASDVAKVRKELPARRLAAAQCLRALRVSQVAWHPATATQRWLARKLLENPFEASRPQPHSRRPLPRPSQRGHEAVRVSCVGVGLRRFKGVFKGQYGLKIHLLKGTDSGPWTPARKAHRL